MTGTATDPCIASTVVDARMRGFDVTVPRDCVATVTRARNARALAQLREAMLVTTPSARHVRLDAKPRGT